MLTNGNKVYGLCGCADKCGQPTGYFRANVAGSKIRPKYVGIISGHRPPERTLVGVDELRRQRRAAVIVETARAVGLVRKKIGGPRKDVQAL